MKIERPFYLVNFSPWPLLVRINIIIFIINFIYFLYFLSLFMFILRFICLFFSTAQWWRDEIEEGLFLGLHVKPIVREIKWGIILFIVSEIYFFFAFFWRFFHNKLRPSMDLGCFLPPYGIESMNPYTIPFLNTLILLRSGVFVSWAHYSLNNKIKYMCIISFILGIILGVYFLTLQLIEYYLRLFSLSDRFLGRIFFVTTGFHGFHVLVGVLFIVTALMRVIKFHFSSEHFLGLELSIWYWHFVDVIWLFLYIWFYWWNN